MEKVFNIKYEPGSYVFYNDFHGNLKKSKVGGVTIKLYEDREQISYLIDGNMRGGEYDQEEFYTSFEEYKKSMEKAFLDKQKELLKKAKKMFKEVK